jgi:hypothetical protein
MRIFRQQSNPLVVFLLIGLIVGGLAGYLTRPETAEIRIGPLTWKSELTKTAS